MDFDISINKYKNKQKLTLVRSIFKTINKYIVK